MDEKRQLIKYVFQNLVLDDEKIFWELHSPFDFIVKCSEYLSWRHLGSMLLEQKVKFRWSLQSVKTVSESLKIEELKD